MPHPIIQAEVDEFEKGYYSFRFEYTDKAGIRRYETGVWNDGMAPEDALKRIAEHVSGFEDGKITDFIDNQYFKSRFSAALQRAIEKAGKEIVGEYVRMSPEEIKHFQEIKSKIKPSQAWVRYEDGQNDFRSLALSKLDTIINFKE